MVTKMRWSGNVAEIITDPSQFEIHAIVPLVGASRPIDGVSARMAWILNREFQTGDFKWGAAHQGGPDGALSQTSCPKRAGQLEHSPFSSTASFEHRLFRAPPPGAPPCSKSMQLFQSSARHGPSTACRLGLHGFRAGRPNGEVQAGRSGRTGTVKPGALAER